MTRLLCLLALFALAAPAAAQCPGGVCYPPQYAQPAPVYSPPILYTQYAPPVYYPPAPVYWQPAPAVYYYPPAPVVYWQPASPCPGGVCYPRR